MTLLTLALLGSAVTVLSTSLGALPALATRGLSPRGQGTLMGFSAGVMLAAMGFSLVLPALRLSESQLGSARWGALGVAGCMLAGGAFLDLCNRFVPHEHFTKGREGRADDSRLRRIWLFVLAIALHNFPEGLAVGSGIGSGDLEIATPILVGIALQDLPEGFVVAAALLAIHYRPREALGVAAATGVVEGAAAMLGYFAVTVAESVLPWALGFAGGAMLYVVSYEMIPESHRQAVAAEATAGLMAGFVLMMFLDVALVAG